MSLSPTSLGDEARLFLREEELDAALELFLLAESALRASSPSDAVERLTRMSPRRAPGTLTGAPPASL